MFINKSNKFYNRAASTYLKKYAKAIISYLSNPQYSNSVQYVPVSQSLNLEHCFFNIGGNSYPVRIQKSHSVREEFLNKIKNINGIIIWGEEGYFTIGDHSLIGTNSVLKEFQVVEKTIKIPATDKHKAYTRTRRAYTRKYRLIDVENIPNVRCYKIDTLDDINFTIDGKFVSLLQDARLDQSIDNCVETKWPYNKVTTNNLYYGIIGQDTSLSHVSTSWKLARDLVYKYQDKWLQNYKVKSLYNKIYSNFKSGKLNKITLKYEDKVTHQETAEELVVNWEYLSVIPNIGKKQAKTNAQRLAKYHATHREDKEARRLRMQAYRAKLKNKQQGTSVETSLEAQPHNGPKVEVATNVSTVRSTEYDSLTEFATQTVIPSADGGPGASPVKLEQLSEA